MSNLQKESFKGENYTYKELGDCIELIIDHRGKTPKKLGSDWVNNGIKTISAKNVNGGKLVNEDSIRCVTYDIYKKWMKEDVKKGDCLLVSEGATLGEYLYWDNEYPIVLGQRIFGIRTNHKILYSKYFYAYMNSLEFQSEIFGRATGSSVSGLRQTEVLKLKVKILPMNEQIFIGDMLYNLNKKIEINHQMNNTLEAIGQAIFKHWFVDFEFPNEEGKPYKSSGGEMEETELGEVPVGWKVKSINEVAEVIKGRSYRSVDLSESTTALVTLKSIERGGGYRRDGLKPFIGEYKPEQVVIPGEMVISYTDVTQAAEVIGRPAIVRSDPTFDTLVASLDLAIIRPKISHLGIPYLYFLFMTDDFQNHIYGHTNGTTVLHLDKNGVPSYNFALPTIPILDKFNEISIRIYEKIENNSQQNRTLATMRDAFLPKLMSGEMRVK